MENKEYLVSYSFTTENGSGTGDIVFPTDKKINGETLEIIRKEISEITKNKTGNKECRIIILNIINLSDL